MQNAAKDVGRQKGGTMSYIRWFDKVGAADVGLVGGKGANLGEMTATGLPVPPGFCVTAEAYRAFVETTGLDAIIREVFTEIDAEDPADVEQKAERIRQAILGHEMPPDVAIQATESYRLLATNLDAEVVANIPVAVRSSATAEDHPDYSFAGMLETYLNIRGPEGLLDHIQQCWASFWTPQVMTYCFLQGIDIERVFVAVVVQAMIPSEVSGIMFTANYLTGNRAEVAINASWGLGEAIVSGLVTPDNILARKEDGGVISYQVAPKTLMVAYAADGGAEELPVPSESRDVPALSEQQVAELVRLARDIETHYEIPQDIEWAYYKERPFVLQSRAITTLSEAVEGQYSRAMFVEIFPEPLSPAFLSVLAPIVHNMLDFFFDQLAFTAPRDLEAVHTFYNQVYINRDYLVAHLQSLSPDLREHLADQMMNPFGRHATGLKSELSVPYSRMMAGFTRFLLSFPKLLPDILSRYQSEVAQAWALPLDDMDDKEILSHIGDLVFDTANRLISYDWMLIASTGITYQAMGLLLKRYFGDETAEVRGRLISGVTGNATMETNKALWDLAQTAKSSPQIVDIFRKYDDEQVLAELESSEAGQSFLADMQRFLDVYGHREIRMDIVYPTWGEDPTPVLGFIRAYLDVAESHSPYRLEEKLVSDRRALEDEVKNRLTERAHGRYVTWPAFRWVYSQARRHTRERDTMHFELTRLFPAFRRMLHELGTRWAERGLIERWDDMFFLTWDDMNEIAETSRPAHAVVRENRAEHETNQRRPWPVMILHGEEIYPERVEPDPEGRLEGVAGSPGLATGPARVIHGPHEFDRLQNGDIMIAPYTTPVWTPLFAIAGGVVTEVGGALSHGAIVAREYGIPAVLGIPNVTEWAQEEQLLTVDGNSGFVYGG
jgi:phosphohistidine swiveling domain-containing protein